MHTHPAGSARRDRVPREIQEHHDLPNQVRQVVVFLDFRDTSISNMHKSKRCFRSHVASQVAELAKTTIHRGGGPAYTYSTLQKPETWTQNCS